MNDRELRQTILDELEFDPSVNAAHIGVAVEDGIVTLSGHVASYAEKIAVERIVRRVKGVRGIAQEIEVRYPQSAKTADDEIAKRAAKIVDWDVRVPLGAVAIKVEKGWVTLTGTVDWHFQKEAAESAVRKLSGVVGVTNLIELRQKVQAPDVKRKIEAALRRNAELEADAIRVDVKGDVVTLEGRVHTYYERNVAERAAWSVPGVRLVNDRIAVA